MPPKRSAKKVVKKDAEEDTEDEIVPETPVKSQRSKRTPRTTTEDDPVVVSRTKRPSSSSTTASSTAPPTVHTPLRVTRSRSRTPGFGEKPEEEEQAKERLAPPAPLDVLSEDEEEEITQVTVTGGRLDSTNLEDSESSLLTVKDSKAMLTMLLLLVLLVGTSVVVSRIQGDSDVSERVIVVLAYSLAPLRAVVEGARVVLGRDQTMGSGLREIDYDQLVARIMESDKFREIVDRVSGDKVERMGLRLNDKLVQEKSDIAISIAGNQKRFLNLEEQLTDIRTEVSEQLRLAKVDIDNMAALKGGDSEILVSDQIKSLEEQIIDLSASLEALKVRTKEGPEGVSNEVLEDFSKLKTKLGELEKTEKESMMAVQQCYKNTGEIHRVIEDKVNTMMNNEMSDLKTNLKAEFVNPLQLKENLAKLATEVDVKVKEATVKVMEENRKHNVKFINDQVAHLRNNLVGEIEANLANIQLGSSENVTMPPSSVVSSPQDVARIVREHLTKYDADKTGLFDFALESAGGSIVTTKCTEQYQATSAVMSVWGLPFWWDANSPRTILQPGSAPGQCWAFRGSYGTVVVKLSSPIYITAVTIEHISRRLSPDGHITSAPSLLSLAGLGPGESLVSLLNFTYRADGDPVQTFPLSDKARIQRFETVELTVHKNHGHPDYTCLYRLRVHGKVTKEERNSLH